MLQLVLGAQAPRTELEPLLLVAYQYRGAVDVGRPPAVGVALGMAHVVPELRPLATQITLSHRPPLALDKAYVYYKITTTIIQ